jgi:hypothetical protein
MAATLERMQNGHFEETRKGSHELAAEEDPNETSS